MFEYTHAVCKDCGKVMKHKVTRRVNKEYGGVYVYEYFKLKCQSCKGDLEKLEVIASWGICNTASLNVFKMEPYAYSERLLIAINDMRPKWHEMLHEMNSEETYIMYGKTKYYLSECMKL